MAITLKEILLAPDSETRVVSDCLTLIDQQVSETSGVSGTAIKLAYKAAATFASGYLRYTVRRMLPDIAEALEPYWADFNASGGSDFGDYLGKRGDEVSEAMLAVSDADATRSERPIIVKAYRTVRASASRHIQAALPEVGKLVLKYAA